MFSLSFSIHFFIFIHSSIISSTIPEETCKTPLFEEHDEWEPDNTIESPISSYSSGADSCGRHSRGGRRNNHSDRGGGGGENGSIGSRGEQPLLSKVTPKSQKKQRLSPGPGAALLSTSSTENSSEDDEDYDEGKIS